MYEDLQKQYLGLIDWLSKKGLEIQVEAHNRKEALAKSPG
jgi:hypothetical protein